MIVLFRSCEANLSPGSLGEGFEDKPRWNGYGKLEILRKCYLSIHDSLDERDLIAVMDGIVQHYDINKNAMFP